MSTLRSKKLDPEKKKVGVSTAPRFGKATPKGSQPQPPQQPKKKK